MKRKSATHVLLLLVGCSIQLARLSPAQCLEWSTSFPYTNSPHGAVAALCVYDDGNGPALYAATNPGTGYNYIAKWNGTSWSPLGLGVDAPIYALAVYDDGSGPALYCGGAFQHAGGARAKNIAKWNGSTWSDVGGGTSALVITLAVFDDGTGSALFVAGRFTQAGGADAMKIAKWNGSWSSLDHAFYPTSGEVDALAVHDDGTGPALYVGGAFNTSIGTTTNANHVVKWDGSHWSSLGLGVSDSSCETASCPVLCLASHDDGTGPALYVGGHFLTAGGSQAIDIARWNGSNWSPVGAGLYGGMGIFSQTVNTLISFDDGRGPALFAGGAFTLSGATPLSNIARWDGQSWSSLAGGASDPIASAVWALCAFDDGTRNGASLFVGGAFSIAGHYESYGIGEWYACAGPGTLFCSGDGSIGVCPCNNIGTTGHGCMNSSVQHGALLFSDGVTNPDNVVLHASGELANALSIFLQGNAALPQPAAFGDGLRCAGGILKRLYVKNASSGNTSAPDAGDPSITQRSAALGDSIAPGSVRYYQVYYRDPNVAFCPSPSGDSWNVTNAAAIQW